MSVLTSIRWQLQLWHGALLALVLAGFGVSMWQWQVALEYQRIDRELEQRVAAVTGALRTGDDPRDRRPPGRRRETDGPASDFYYVAWAPDGQERLHSAQAPADVPRPEPAETQRSQRLRGTLREFIFFTPQGEAILIGRDIGDELAALRQSLWLIAGAGGLVFLLGLAGGWWVSTRALRPIADISAAAARISTGDLSQRIPTPPAGNELAGLAAVLNDGFARLHASLERQQRFTSDASHELRTPVAVVLTRAQTALARERTPDEYRDSLAACERAAQRMTALIESLLTLARLDAGDAAAPAPCALDVIATETVDLLQPLAERHGVLVATDGRPAPCLGNAGQLAQVVTNLVDNAITYSRRGGHVRVTTTSTSQAVQLEVTDDGIGIAPADLPHVFDRFYRADPARSGAKNRTGLGLAIAKAIVERHGGSIAIDSRLEAGTTVRVTLPSVAAAAARA